MIKWLKNAFRNSCFSNPKYNGFAVVQEEEHTNNDLTEMDKLALKAAEEDYNKNPSSLERVVSKLSNELD